MKKTITLLDEVNCQFDGFTRSEISKISECVSYLPEGYFQMAAYKLGNVDACKERLMTPEGVTFIYLIPEILDYMDLIGFNTDAVELVDERPPVPDLDIPLVDENFLLEETGFPLRPHQQEGINAVIQGRKGILEYATSSGKTLCTVGISKAFDGILKSLVIVPSETLVHQTYEDYAKTNLNAIALTKKIKPAKRAQAFKDHDHVIITSKLLANCLEHVDGEQYVVMLDECHVNGPILLDALRFELGNCPIRVGMTATMPTHELKNVKTKATIGGDVLSEVTTKFLSDESMVSSSNIEVITIDHPEIDDVSNGGDIEWTWDLESHYTGSNVDRIDAIASHIESLPKTNTLILCHAAVGKMMSDRLGSDLIVDETPTNERKEMFTKFDDSDYTLVASFGTSGTGLSINRIFRVILIDVGKNETYIKQSIGRGLRLDGDRNEVEIIDISSNTKYAKKHRKSRIKVYERDEYNYFNSETTITVKEA